MWHFHPEHQLTLVLESRGHRMVGDNCGFSNLANFNRHFRTLIRLSPREYRERFRETAG